MQNMTAHDHAADILLAIVRHCEAGGSIHVSSPLIALAQELLGRDRRDDSGPLCDAHRCDALAEDDAELCEAHEEMKK